MKAIERVIQAVGRFAVGFGIGLALVCALVIVTSDRVLDPARDFVPEVVRLDPVVVTISAERFDQLQAIEVEQARWARSFARKPNEG